MRWLKIFLLLIVTVTGLFTLLGFLGEYAYFFELVSHFRPQYALAAGFCILFFVWMKQRMAIVLSIALLVINAIPILPFYIRLDTPAPSSEKTVSVLLMNVLSSNDRFDLVREQVEAFQPDIVVLEEVNRKWFEALRALNAAYPYTVHALQEDNFGIWTLSRVPLSDSEIVYWGQAKKPSICLRFLIDTTTVRLIATHPLPPTSPRATHLRNDQLMAIAAHIQEGENLVVVGDLNTSSFSPSFQEFIRSTGLHDSRLGHGLQPTWPAWSIEPLMTTLDHCLVGENLRVVRRERGGYTGSDHLPVYTEMAVSQ